MPRVITKLFFIFTLSGSPALNLYDKLSHTLLPPYPSHARILEYLALPLPTDEADNTTSLRHDTRHANDARQGKPGELVRIFWIILCQLAHNNFGFRHLDLMPAFRECAHGLTDIVFHPADRPVASDDVNYFHPAFDTRNLCSGTRMMWRRYRMCTLTHSID